MGKVFDWVRGHAIASVIVAFILGVAVGGGASQEGAATQVASEQASAVEDEPEEEPIEEEEAEEPDEPEVVDGEYGLASCELDLGTPYRLLGSTEVENTGNVPTTYQTSFRWLLGDGSQIKAEPKTFELRPGQSKLVFFKTNIDQDQVSLFQDHPDYMGGNPCKTNATIRDSK